MSGLYQLEHKIIPMMLTKTKLTAQDVDSYFLICKNVLKYKNIIREV